MENGYGCGEFEAAVLIGAQKFQTRQRAKLYSLFKKIRLIQFEFVMSGCDEERAAMRDNHGSDAELNLSFTSI